MRSAASEAKSFAMQASFETGTPRVAQRCSLEHHRRRGVELGRHVGETKRDRLMIRDRLAERGSLFGIADRMVEGGRASHAHALGGDADASGFQVGQRDSIPVSFVCR